MPSGAGFVRTTALAALEFKVKIQGFGKGGREDIFILDGLL